MPGFTIGLLKLVDTAGEELLKVVLGSSYEKLKSVIKSKPVKHAIKIACAEAINSYRSSPSPNESFLSELDSKGSFLKDKGTIAEVFKIFSATEKPNVSPIAAVLADSYGFFPTKQQFEQELTIFFDILSAKMRNQEALTQFFEAGDIKQIADDIRAFLQREKSLEKLLINSQWLIEQKTEVFTGRKWLFDEVEDFIKSPKNKSGYFFILGDPGIGKSALAAKLVSDRGWIYHFNVRREGINHAADFLENICAKLILRNSLDPSQYLPIETKSAATLEKIFFELNIQDGTRQVILIDALDEIDAGERNGSNNPLFLPRNLPDGIFIVLTCRNNDEYLPAVFTENKRRVIDAASADNQQDIKDYISSMVTQSQNAAYLESQGISQADFTNTFAEKSEFNFMYVSHVLPKLLLGNSIYNNIPLERLPSGLKGYYYDQWQYMKGVNKNEWLLLKLPILAALSLDHGFISSERIYRLIRDYYSIVKETSPLPSIGRIEDSMRSDLKEYIHVHPTEADKFRLYHESFYDFIREQGGIKSERLELDKMNRAYTDHLLRDFENS